MEDVQGSLLMIMKLFFEVLIQIIIDSGIDKLFTGWVVGGGLVVVVGWVVCCFLLLRLMIWQINQSI